MTVTILTAAGTWAPFFVGYPADVGRALTSEWDDVQAEIMGLAGPRFRWQPIGYPAVGFLNPDPNTSYNESVEMGVREGLRLLNGIPGEVDLVGYSQGAEVVIRIANEMLQARRPPRRIVTFGSPCKRPGRTYIGNNPPGSGISRYYGSSELWRRTTDIVRDRGEMYGNAPDDTYLPDFYKLFVQAEVSLPFAVAVFGFLTPYIAGGIEFLTPVVTGAAAAVFTNNPQALFEGVNPLAAMEIVDIPKAIRTAQVLADFIGTQAHTSYHLPAPEFGGRTGIQVAVDALNA